MIVAQMHIGGRGAKVTMPQKSLDHRQVHPVFQKMAGETVSLQMNSTGLGNARSLGPFLVSRTRAVSGHRAGGPGTGK